MLLLRRVRKISPDPFFVSATCQFLVSALALDCSLVSSYNLLIDYWKFSRTTDKAKPVGRWGGKPRVLMRKPGCLGEGSPAFFILSCPLYCSFLRMSGQRGREIFNFHKQKKSVAFKIGTDKVMQGWNEGVIGMQAGGTRMLRIPPELGYGAKAVDDVVPSHAHLIFIVELLELK